ncbi:MAG: riboflavin synthase [Synergistales bacterium]|nr:riboflavin synthase [Synergistales bacterium]
MFTGLIEQVGRVEGCTRQGDVHLLRIGAPGFAGMLVHGQSVAVSGACLSVVETGADHFAVEMMPETLERTRLGDVRPGEAVNLERSLTLERRLDGHLVTGHVDTLVTVRSVLPWGRSRLIECQAPERVVPLVVEKGSVALDGVSLTVAARSGVAFSVGVIPTTLAETTLGRVGPGDRLHLETDILGKYVASLLEGKAGDLPAAGRENTGGGTIGWEDLQRYGWV